MNLHDRRALTDALIGVLRGAGLLVGDAVAPAGAAWQGTAGSSTFRGYVVVYPMAGGLTDGSLGSPDDDADVLYQTTSLGGTRQQCELIADKVHAAILDGVWTLVGRVVARVEVDMLGGAARDDDTQPPIFYSPDRYRFVTTPAVAAVADG